MDGQSVMFFKKKITQDLYIEILDRMCEKIGSIVAEEFQNEIEKSNNTPNVTEKINIAKERNAEIQFFSLWIITVSLPPENNALRIALYESFVDRPNGPNIFEYCEERDDKFVEIDWRNQNYYHAFNIWRENPQSGHMIGTAMIEMIKNLNSDFLFDEGIPLVSDIEATKAFILFSKVFTLTLQSMEQLNGEVRIVE